MGRRYRCLHEMLRGIQAQQEQREGMHSNWLSMIRILKFIIYGYVGILNEMETKNSKIIKAYF